jgi:hypothetical protein
MTYRDDDTATAARREADARRQLPMLDRLEIASPCDRNWDDMMRTADERVRACGGCNKHVYEVSGMTAEEVDRLMLETDGKACVRYYQRGDGTILLADCTVGGRRRAVKRYVVAGLLAAVAGSALVSGATHATTYHYVFDDSPMWSMGESGRTAEAPPDPPEDPGDENESAPPGLRPATSPLDRGPGRRLQTP